MKDQQQIIPAQPAHYEAIASIYNEYIRLGNATMEETEKSGADIAQWVDNFNDRERLFTLLEKDRVIGWGIIKRYSDREGYRFACETAVYLTSDKIGYGYGTLIKKFL
ncbi:MAG: N-acetyltransferase, partial [Bacteroidota bacterium]